MIWYFKSFYYTTCTLIWSLDCGDLKKPKCFSYSKISASVLLYCVACVTGSDVITIFGNVIVLQWREEGTSVDDIHRWKS